MSNKSFTTKGLSRQLEEKANKLQDELAKQREKHSELQASFDEKLRRIRKLEEELQDQHQDADVRNQKLQDQHDLLQHDHVATVRKCESLNSQLQQTVKDLQSKSEEKDLLHSRHDALTAESRTLQRDMVKANLKAQELETSLQDEKQHAEENDRQLRAEAKDEISRRSDLVNKLERTIEDLEGRFAADRDRWDSERRGLESQKEIAEGKATALQRTIDKLQNVEGTLSSEDFQLQEALRIEKERHVKEEAVLERQIQDLNADVERKRQDLNELRTDMSQAKEDLRIREREAATLQEKVQALEDEVEILQSELDGDDAEQARQRQESASREVDFLRTQLEEAQEQLEAVQGASNERESHQYDQINGRLRFTEQQLENVQTEKQALEDRLATANLELRHLHASVEMEAERDEMQSRLEQMRNPVDDTFKRDHEKVDLRTAKAKLDGENGRLREERKGFLERNADIERELEAEIARAASEEARLSSQILDLQRRLNTASSGRDRESLLANKQAQRLGDRVQELEAHLASVQHHEDAAAELTLVQKDLSAARNRELEYLQRETAQKEVLRELKHKVSRLERQTHDAEAVRLSADSPKSSVASSTRKQEVTEMERQLRDAHQQLKDARSKSKDDLKGLQRRLEDFERQAQIDSDAYEQQREQLEAELSNARHEKEFLQAKNDTIEQTLTRLRTRISSLEQDLRGHRQLATADNTMAEERAELHEMLKDAKLQAEDLQVQIDARETSLAAATSKETELRTQLRRVREERNSQTRKSNALSAEFDNLQSRYEDALDNHSHQQRAWEDERKAIASRVRFTNTSISSLHAHNEGTDKLEKRHAGEIKGLAKQIHWLRAKCQREQGFRTSLIYEKKFLTMQIDMFEAWYVFLPRSPCCPNIPTGSALFTLLTKTTTAIKSTFNSCTRWASRPPPPPLIIPQRQRASVSATRSGPAAQARSRSARHHPSALSASWSLPAAG